MFVLKKIPVYGIALIVVTAFIVLAFAGRVPGAIAAFKGRMEAHRLNGQLLHTYTGLGGLLSFELPYSWSTSQAAFEGGEINYHLNFISKDRKVHGFVQVWKLDKPLKQFLEESEKSAVGIIDFKYYKVKEIMANKKHGFLLEYGRANEKGEYIKAYEAFIEGYGRDVVRVSFFIPEKEWKEYYKILFDRIIGSVDIKKPSN